jgi:hypothetical protein
MIHVYATRLIPELVKTGSNLLVHTISPALSPTIVQPPRHLGELA